MQIIGLCRFSYLGLGGFQIEHESLEERAAFLYAQDRLEERFKTFECITLPAIKAQTDKDFIFIIVTGNSLPKEAKERLSNLIQDCPQAKLITLPPLRHRPAMKRAINKVLINSSEPSVQFRLDDDDAVSIHFIERLRQASEKARIFLDDMPLAIDFNQGYLAIADAKGLKTAPIQQPYWTAGLALMFPPNSETSLMHFPHHKAPKQMTTLTFTGEDMMIRGLNDYNDSKPDRHINQARLHRQSEDEENYFRRIYAIDADHVRRVYSKN